MDFEDSPSESAFRWQARDWLSANAPNWKGADGYSSFEELLPLGRLWQARKADAGWACLGWPPAYGGRGASAVEQVIWAQEEGELGMLSTPFVIGHGMCGPTLIAHASEEQRRRYLPPLVRGDEIWCQMFSEPAAGSDLAGIRMRAVKDGDRWILNGQKIWTSFAHFADYAIVLTRTDPDVPKHRGLTMFFLDMRSPGVKVRPLRQASGGSDFNEVFVTDVAVPDAQRLGAVGEGWKVALTTLMNERLAIGGSFHTDIERYLAFAASQRGTDGPWLEDSSAIEALADWYVTDSALKFTTYRILSSLKRGALPGAEASLHKLVIGAGRQRMTSWVLDRLELAGVLTDPSESVAGGLFQQMFLRAPGNRIEGGTDEILRNVIAEQVLGLPADIRADKAIPFSQIPGPAI